MAATTLDCSRAQCPFCFGSLSFATLKLVCQSCAHEYRVVDGIAELLMDPTSDSMLDLAEYEADHPVDPDARANLFRTYNSALLKYGVSGGACLEIGSGTGNLTAGLVTSSSFDQVNCSDVSLRFLKRLRQTIADSEKLRCWIFDAERLPFKSGSMSAIFGHSVLHHLLDYEAAVKDVFRVLCPGGLAMFGEPIMDNHSITGLCAGLILKIERRHPTNTFTEVDLSVLERIRSWSGMVGSKMRSDRQGLAHLEDKHIYVVKDFVNLAQEIGFHVANYQNGFTTERIGDDHFYQLSFMMDRLGSSGRKLDPYKFIFEEVTNTYGKAMGNAAPVNFGYFILQK